MHPGHNRLIDLSGKQFGIWRVVEKSTRTDNKTRWLCECVTCGKRVTRRSGHLRSGEFARCDGKHRERAGLGGTQPGPVGYAAGTEVYGLYKRRAKLRGLSFSLLRTEFDLLSREDCHYCGKPPIQRSVRRHFNGAFVYNGIDRKDNRLGYELNNCVPCCGDCNSMKSNLSYEEFLQRITAIYQRHVGGTL